MHVSKHVLRQRWSILKAPPDTQLELSTFVTCLMLTLGVRESAPIFKSNLTQGKDSEAPVFQHRVACERDASNFFAETKPFGANRSLFTDGLVIRRPPTFDAHVGRVTTSPTDLHTGVNSTDVNDCAWKSDVRLASCNFRKYHYGLHLTQIVTDPSITCSGWRPFSSNRTRFLARNMRLSFVGGPGRKGRKIDLTFAAVAVEEEQDAWKRMEGEDGQKRDVERWGKRCPQEERNRALLREQG
eukprot:scaffold192_cov331-Pavlova_lutheri.AAC.9